jgi:hypothetical protein
MTTLSNPTLGLLIEIAAEERSRDELETLLMKADLRQESYRGYDSGGSSKHGLVRYWLRGAREVALQGDVDAHRALLTFTRVLVEKTVPDPDDAPGWFGELCDALLGDGYQLTWDRDVEQIDPWRERVTVTYRILSTDTGPAPLGNEISALEQELDSRGYSVALNHYRQAVDTFGQHQYEAANGQLRTALEALVVGLAKDHVGYVGQGKAGEGSAAIEHIVTKSRALPDRDGGRMLRGLWQMTHTNGPHPGQSTADEARIRMQIITAAARFLLNHFRT